jgi:hypothetical protein
MNGTCKAPTNSGDRCRAVAVSQNRGNTQSGSLSLRTLIKKYSEIGVPIQGSPTTTLVDDLPRGPSRPGS